MTLLRGDNLEIMPQLPAGMVQHILTSPPFNVAWDYAGAQNDRLPTVDYLDMLRRFLDLCQATLRHGGVLSLNLPHTFRTLEYEQSQEGSRSMPIAAWAEHYLWETGWLIREPLIWVKSKGDVEVRATSTAIGAYTNPYLRPCHEFLIVASVGTYQIPNREPRWPGDEWAFGRYLEVCKDVWSIQPGKAKRGEPLAYPDQLVQQSIMLYSNPGDIVLDPFAGNGTTLRVARNMGREPWGIEREPAFWPRIEHMLAQEPMMVGAPDLPTTLREQSSQDTLFELPAKQRRRRA